MISLLAKRSGFDESQLGIWFNPFELNQPIIPLLTFFFILIACLLDIVLIMRGEILFWSLVGLKGLM